MRTQIALEPEQHARVKRKAASLGLTMAEYIRRLVDRDLGDTTAEADPAAIFGLGGSGGSDIAGEKKTAVAAAVSARKRTR
jgi:hypothetical protein